jgi:IS30 family transposase
MNNINYKHISHDERVLIVDDFNDGLSVSQMARKRQRDKSTISRELRKCRIFEKA